MQLLDSFRFVSCHLVTFSVAVDFSIPLSEVTSHTMKVSRMGFVSSSVFSVCKFRILALIVTADELPLIDLTVCQSIQNSFFRFFELGWCFLGFGGFIVCVCLFICFFVWLFFFSSNGMVIINLVKFPPVKLPRNSILLRVLEKGWSAVTLIWICCTKSWVLNCCTS